MVDYFSHDYGARNDPKLQNLFMEHGTSGIGIYWCLVEQLYEQGGEIELKNIKAIAFNLRETDEKVSSVINDFGLFVTKKDKFYSTGVKKRLILRQEKVEKLRKNAKARWKNELKQQEQSNSNANVEQMESNKKKGKGKDKDIIDDDDSLINARARDPQKNDEDYEITGELLQRLCNAYDTGQAEKRKIDSLFGILKKDEDFWVRMQEKKICQKDLIYAGRLICKVLSEYELEHLTVSVYEELATKCYHIEKAKHQEPYVRKCYEQIIADRQKAVAL